MLIRKCQPDDYEPVCRLLETLWPEQAIDTEGRRAVFLRSLTSANQYLCCGLEDDLIAGFASVHTKNSLWQQGVLAHVDELVVEPSCRNHGLGSKLLEALMSWAIKQGCSRIELDSGHHRKKSHLYYERTGFVSRGLVFSKPLKPLP